MNEQPVEKAIKRRRIDVLNLLMANCKQSDREIAKKAKVSQPTVTRIRASLEQAGIIKEYMAIPDYAKLGYEFGAIIVGQFPKLYDESIFASAFTFSGDTDVMLITLHRTIEGYNTLLDKIKAMKREGSNVATVLFSTKDLQINPVKAPGKAA